MNYEGVLKPYKDKIENAKRFFTFNRDPYSHWPIFMITTLATILTPKCFFDYLLECEFVDPTYIRCPLCQGQMQLNINSSKADGVRWECKSIKKKKETTEEEKVEEEERRRRRIHGTVEASLQTNQDIQCAAIQNEEEEKPCNKSRTARTNTWFYQSKLSLPEVMLITYHWWYKVI